MVYFDTVYPGWYSSRTTHIHTTIRINGTEYATAQFPFADRVSDFVYRKHPLYNTRSLRTTNNTNDGVFDSSNLQTYTFETRYKDGQIQIFKTIGIRSSTPVLRCLTYRAGPSCVSRMCCRPMRTTSPRRCVV